MSKATYARRASCCVLAALLLAPAQSLLAQDESQIEEIVVTGSFIKRDSFDSPSPLTVVDSEAIEANATPNLGEVMVAQTFNYGTDFQTNTYAARAQIGNISQSNIRGLGAGATLDLIDGKRTNNPFLTNSMPQIAIQRIDVLKDSAAALYGTDAVAGVVNIIPNKTYEGVTTSVFYTSDKNNDFDETQIEMLMGSAFDRGHFSIAGRYATRGTLRQTERPEFLRKGFDRSGTGNPGDWLVPQRDASGAIVDSNPNVPGHQDKRMVDPGCGAYDGPGGKDNGVPFNYQSGDPNGGAPGAGSNCRLHFGEWWNFMNPQDQYSVWTNYTFEFSDNITNDLDLTFSRLKTGSRGSAQNPGGRTEEFPIVLGTHPGNPYRAYGDINGNGVLDDGEQLFALDADNDGIPDRGTDDINGDGVPDVMLHPDAFNPDGGGIPFNEDVDVVALRAYGKLGTKAKSLGPDAANTGNASFTQIDFRVADTLTIAFPDSSWELALSGVWEEFDWNYKQKNTSQSALVAGLQGLLVPDPTSSSTAYWNPFSTSQLNCVDRVCSNTGTPTFNNEQAVMDAVDISTVDNNNFTFWSLSAIVTGELFELPAGKIGTALGIDYFKETSDVDLNAEQNRCDWHEGGCGFDYKASQDVYSLFFEFSVPVIENAELNLAGRYVDYGGSIGDDFTPKFSALWQPVDWLSLRGSWGQAFIAPTLEDQFEPEDCGLQTANDPVTGDLSQSFRVACVSGNPELFPETADVWNVGFSLDLLDGNLKFGMDYSVYDFTDRIAQTALNNVLNQDFANYKAAGFTAGDPNDYLLWPNDPRSDPAIIRDSTGVITRVITTRLNATQMKHKAYDFYGTYVLGLDTIGTFTFNLMATFVDEYSYDLGPGLPSGDAAGRQNEELIDIPPMPEWRVNGTLNWLLGGHSAMIRLRWTDGFDLSFNSSGLQAAQVAVNGTDRMKSILYTDINYSYRWEGLFGESRDTTFEFGGRNIFDEYPPVLLNLGGIESFVHDIRGAMWYIRLKQDL
jgi:iron complex outermembrane receptor protein